MPWPLLKDVLERPEKWGDISKNPIVYSPCEKEINFPKSKTGWIYDQAFKTEQRLTYLPVLHDDEVYLVSCQTTEQRLFLVGLDGYRNAIVILRKFARLFSNTLMNAEGVILDEETIGVLSQLPEEYRTIEGRIYWTAIKSCELEREPPIEKYGMYTITPLSGKPETLYSHGGRYGKEAHTVCAFLRPVIRFNQSVRVNVDALETGTSLQIIPV